MGSNAGDCNRPKYKPLDLLRRRKTRTWLQWKNFRPPRRANYAIRRPVSARLITQAPVLVADCKDRALEGFLESFRLLGVQNWSPTVIPVAICRYTMRHTTGIGSLLSQI
jgi:hypothetical protein